MFDPASWQLYLLAIIIGYLVGSTPFGLILTRMAGQGDIRKIGSGNIGATNVLRTGNKALAALTLILDAGKGAVMVVLGSILFGTDVGWIAGLGAFLGHLFPVWLKFKGGKGVATTLGILFAVDLLLGAATALTWLATAFLFRYSSLSALVCLATAPFIGYALLGPEALVFVGILSVISWARHSSNIMRLIRGEESKINLSRKRSPDTDTNTATAAETGDGGT